MYLAEKNSSIDAVNACLNRPKPGIKELTRLQNIN